MLSERFINFSFGIDAMQNLLTVFYYSVMTQMADRSQTSTGLSVNIYGGLHKVLTLPATSFASKTNSVMFLERPMGMQLYFN